MATTGGFLRVAPESIGTKTDQLRAVLWEIKCLLTEAQRRVGMARRAVGRTGDLSLGPAGDFYGARFCLDELKHDPRALGDLFQEADRLLDEICADGARGDFEFRRKALYREVWLKG